MYPYLSFLSSPHTKFHYSPLVDAFHYMHHRYFECNYAGFSAGWLDVFFNTFHSSMASEKDGVKQRADAKSTLREIPSLSFSVYLLGSILLVVAPFYYILNNETEVRKWDNLVKLSVSFVAGFGPEVLALIMSKNDQKFTLGLIFHFIVGNIVSVLPISIMAYYMLA
jgi:hypothetical protein